MGAGAGAGAGGLVAFHRGEAPDDRGRRLEEIWRRDDAWLESRHDFIQWLFPLPERSGANPAAPVLTPEDLATFRADPLIRANLERSYRRMVEFYGLAGAGEPVRRHWLTPGNHNYLRLSRILRCLTLCGLDEQAGELFRRLEEIYQREGAVIGETTFGYWRRAAGRPRSTKA